MVNIDRISEAYFGEMGEEFAVKTRKRISWICNKVDGNKVLDIGCSQGITSFLLAKEGKEVIGIDVVEQSIEYAKSLLKIDELPKLNLKFICNDFIQEEFHETFNTIILTEVLEHLENPITFIEKAYSLMDMGAKFILTVPFGINDHPDHKRTYYMAELIEQVSPYIEISDIQVFCNDEGIAEWIGIEGLKRDFIQEKSEKFKICEIKQLEEYFYSRERMLVDHNYNLINQTIHFNNAINSLTLENKLLIDSLKPIEDEIFINIDFKKDFRMYDSNKIIVNKNIIGCSGHIENEEYISIYENNLDLNMYPQKLIDPGKVIEVNFEGNIKGNLELMLIVVYYSSNELLRFDKVKIGEKKIIHSPLDTKCIRLFVSVKGWGIADINHITLKSKEDSKEIKNLNELKVACIFDEFTTECYRDMCKLIHVKPNNWKKIMREQRPDILIVESAWCGIDNSWQEKILNLNKVIDEDLLSLIIWCKFNNIPTIFWNKEDPVSFDLFIGTAKYFDYIFTTDAESINKYKKILERDNIFLSMFAASPSKHNPIKVDEDYIDKAFFAGAYYPHFEQRNIDFEKLFNASKNTIGVDIYDRNFIYEGNLTTFPKVYHEHILGKINPTQINNVYKKYKVGLNVNTVKESSTMFARRIFELLACGTPVVSSYSNGINDIFKGIVLATDDEESMKIELENLSGNKVYYDYKKNQGIRDIFRNHTYEKRLTEILKKANIEVKQDKKTVIAISFIENNEQLEYIINLYKKQTYSEKALVIVAKSLEDLSYDGEYDINDIEFIDKSIFMESKLKLIDIIKSEYVTYMNVENYYGKYYIEDFINATMYSDADYIGKKQYIKYINSQFETINEGESFEYVTSLINDRCLISTECIKNITLSGFYEMFYKRKDIDTLKYGRKFLSIDKYNFIDGISDIDIDKKLSIEI